MPLERGDLLPARSYAVEISDTKTKLAIAQQAARGVSAEPFAELLGTVGSGLEAKMIGQLGQQLPPDTSKYGLFDAYVRERLGSAASDGIRALSRIAGMMTERISFGLSVRRARPPVRPRRGIWRFIADASRRAHPGQAWRPG